LLNQADAHRLPLPAQAFDVIICHSSLPHFADKSAALCELKRVLRPGGHLIILHDIGREMVNAIHTSAAEAARGDLLPTGQELQSLLAQAGLVEIHVEDTPDHYLAVGRVPVTRSCSALRAEGLVVRYGALRALDGVSLTVEAGEMMGLFGPNGAGKSTFMKAAMGLVRIDGGTLSVLDTALSSPAYRRVRPQLGYVPQRLPNGRFPVTVWDAVAMGRYGLAGVGRSLTSQDRAFVQEALGCVGLAHLAERRVQDLSGGQAQRVGIARALAQQPQMLLLDEPTANLDRDGQLELAQQVQALNRERGITVLIVSHSMDVAHLCRRLCFFEAGRVSRIEEMPNHA
jgi:ABC-type Mn2+/Zn2+ transport system ATPase subunit